MTEKQISLDAIVRAIVDVLEKEAARRNCSAAAGASHPAGRVGSDAAEEKTLHVKEHVVTAIGLRGAVAGYTSLTVAARAIVTPEARDFLQDAKISWRRRETGQSET